MLNKNAELNGNSPESFMYFAETYDAMQIYEKSVNAWFKYLDEVEEGTDLSDAYEGLASCFMNMGQDNFAAYYYNKLLIETADDLTAENREEIIDAFLSSDDKNTLKFAYPPRLADFSNEIENGLDFMRSNEYDKAITEFSKVSEGNERHSVARNYIAMCKVISDKCEEAEEECNAILAKYPDDVQALTTLAAVKSQQKKTDESKELAYKLLTLNAQNTDEIFKIATVCCENGLHEEAYTLFCKLEEDLTYDSSVLFFKAISAYNCGKMNESLETFDTLLTIYPCAETARYYKEYVEKRVKKKEYLKKPLNYFYRLPQAEQEANIQVLTVFSSLSNKNAMAFLDAANIEDCIIWCYDEGESKGIYELELLGGICAVKGHLDGILHDILLKGDVSDGIKMELIGAITERNEADSFGVVICNMYKKMTVLPIEIGKLKKKSFIKAYALLVSRFGILDENYIYLLNSATVKLYYNLEKEEKLNEVKHVNSLCAAIYYLSGIKESGLDKSNIVSFFGAKEANFNTLIGNEQE
jgi:tetratricopeptide (TPR) repeat protein